MSSTCEKCRTYDDSTDEYAILGIPCDLCNTCYRSWLRRHHKNPDSTRFEVLGERISFMRVSHIGKAFNPDQSFEYLDIIVEEREAIELKMIEDAIDWLEDSLG